MNEPNPSHAAPPKDFATLLATATHLHERNQLAGAEALYLKILANEPNHFKATHLQGVLKHQQGSFRVAADFLRRAVALNPTSALAHLNLGHTLWSLTEHEAALDHFLQSFRLNPKNADALFHAAFAQQFLQRPSEALPLWDQLLRLSPNTAAALLNRGMVLQDLQQGELALESFRRALSLEPDLAEILLGRAHQLEQALRLPEALAAFEVVLSIRPNEVNANLARGCVLAKLQRHTEALAAFDRALELEPNRVDALINRSTTLLELQRTQEAWVCIELAMLLKPDSLDALSARGLVQLALGRTTDALASFDRALLQRPESPELLLNRGNTLLQLNRPAEALAIIEKTLLLSPNWLDLRLNRVAVLHALGRHHEALVEVDQVLAIEPGRTLAHSTKIALSDFLPELSFRELQAERHQFYLTQAQQFVPTNTILTIDRNPSRRLVLGYVSADFKHHSAAACFLPILQRHNRAEFQINCYSGVTDEDDWTLKCREAADLWRQATQYSDEALAEQIREDKVDILVDLSGHSRGNRLLVFARKPAPIQVTAWGHGGGTGLPMMDYQFTDPVWIPQWARPFFAEACFDLPCCITFEAPTFAPEVAPLPAQTRGLLTFGSLNRYSKVTSDVESLWARILQAVPNSRLLLKDSLFDDPAGRLEVIERFARLGIGEERLQLRGKTSHRDHLAAYGEVDIALDPFPMNGGISSWEALAMGTPVVAMLGHSQSSRISGAILHAVGLGEWVAEDADGYVGIAQSKASDMAALARLRGNLRSLIQASPAGNLDIYTRKVEQAYRDMWHCWINKQGAFHR